MPDYHHFTKDPSDPCPECGKPRLWGWEDEEEKNGRAAARWDVDGICAECYQKRYGKGPNSLEEIAEERKREKISNSN